MFSVKLDTFAQADQSSGAVLGPWTPPGSEQWKISQQKCFQNIDAWNLGCGPTDELQPGFPNETVFSFKASSLVIRPDSYDVVDLVFAPAPGASFSGNAYYVEYLMEPSFANATSEQYAEFLDSGRTKYVLAEAGFEKRITSPIETVCTWDLTDCALDVTDLFYEAPGKLLPTLDMSQVVLIVNVLHKGTLVPGLASTTKFRVRSGK